MEVWSTRPSKERDDGRRHFEIHADCRDGHTMTHIATNSKPTQPVAGSPAY